MSFSCTDFVDEFLQQLVSMGLIKDSDLPEDDPLGQSVVVAGALDRVRRILGLSGEAVALLEDAAEREELRARDHRKVLRPLRHALKGVRKADGTANGAPSRAGRRK